MHDRGVYKSIRLRLKMVEDVTEAVQEEDTLTDYLKKSNLVPPKHYTSKIWKYFGFKVNDIDSKHVFFGLCGMKLKYCCNAMNIGDAFERSASTILWKV